MSQNEPELPPLHSDAAAVRQMRGFLVGASLLLLAGSWLLWSSPEYRELHLLVFSLLALTAFGAVLWPLLRRSGARGLLLGCGVLLAHAAAWVGAAATGTAAAAASLSAAKGLVGVAGLGVLAAVWLEPRWRGWLRATGYGMLGMVLVASLIGYAVRFEDIIPLGGHGYWFDNTRLAAWWPTRLLTACHGQIAWENANYSGYYFGLALALMLEALAAGGIQRQWWRWVLVGLLAAALFLTASRMGALMVVLALPVVLVGRSPRFALKSVLVAAVGAACGYGMLTAKVGTLEREAQARAAAEAAAREMAQPMVPAASPTTAPAEPAAQAPRQPPPPPERIPTTETHTKRYFERASSGRTQIYKALWQEGRDSRWCGLGLAVAGSDILKLNHEHSSYMATLRGGGLLGVAGHVMVLLATAWSAWLALRRGTRWPAVLALAGLGGLLFDRSTVWALTGNYEFPAHWLAVWLSVLVATSVSSPPRSTSTISPLGG